MSHFSKMMDKIKEDERIPEKVWDRYVHTLENLPEKKPEAKKSYWTGRAAAAAFGIVGAGCILCSNPALASRIPLLGDIFRQVEKIVTYSGDYSDHAAALSTEEGEEAGKENLFAEDAGIRISASEALYDGMSVFLTLKMDADQGNLENIPKYSTGNEATEGSSIVYLWGEYQLSGENKPWQLTGDGFYLEGKALDDHTYVGMAKMDIDQEGVTEGILSLNLSAIGYDGEKGDVENKDGYRWEGNWDLQIPFQMDEKRTKHLTFDTKGKPYGVKEMTISPYQIVTVADIPYTEKNVTQEEYEEAMKAKTEGLKEDYPMSYQEYAQMEKKTYAEYHTALFNQEGEEITQRMEYGNGKSVFAVQGMDITKLQVLIFDSLDTWMEMDTGKLTNEAIEAAVDYEVIEIKSFPK